MRIRGRYKDDRKEVLKIAQTLRCLIREQRKGRKDSSRKLQTILFLWAPAVLIVDYS
jgi:hypothetical protein